MDVGEISRTLATRAEEIAGYLLPNGKKASNEWCVGSTDGETGRSLKVHLTGNKAGVWKDFAGGEGGDLIDLWQSVKGISLQDAVRAAKDYLGITAPQFEGSRQKTYKRPEKPVCRRPAPDSPVMEYLCTERKLTAETIAAYRLGEQEDGQGGIIVLPFKRGDELINFKFLRLDRDEKGKKKSWFSPGCELCLFGWQVIDSNARSIIITEGEIDAMTWYQYGFPAMSMPNGAKSHTWVENEFENLERFDTIYLSFDMDADGRAGVAMILDRLGRHRCRVVKLPFKDANECLLEGISAAEMASYLQGAETDDPAELRRASGYVEEVIDAFYPPNEVEPGFLSPWSKLKNLLRFRPSELSVWTGYSGHGKTTLLNQVIIHALTQGEQACIASLEIKPKTLLKRITKQVTAQRLPDVDLIYAAHKWYDDKLWIFDLVGNAKAARLLEVWRYARQRYGITQFVVDSLMRCGIGEDDYNGQKQFTDSLVEFANEHDCHVHLVAHARKTSNDKQAAGRLDVKGSSAITDLAHNCFTVWRNMDKDRERQEAAEQNRVPDYEIMERPDAYLACDKMREGEWVGQAALWFDADSQQFVQEENQPPMIYVTTEDQIEEGTI